MLFVAIRGSDGWQNYRPRVGNFRQKNNSTEDGIDETNRLFRRNSGCSAEQKTVRRGKCSEFRIPWNKNRSKLSKFRYEPFCGRESKSVSRLTKIEANFRSFVPKHKVKKSRDTSLLKGGCTVQIWCTHSKLTPPTDIHPPHHPPPSFHQLIQSRSQRKKFQPSSFHDYILECVWWLRYLHTRTKHMVWRCMKPYTVLYSGGIILDPQGGGGRGKVRNPPQRLFVTKEITVHRHCVSAYSYIYEFRVYRFFFPKCVRL